MTTFPTAGQVWIVDSYQNTGKRMDKHNTVALGACVRTMFQERNMQKSSIGGDKQETADMKPKRANCNTEQCINFKYSNSGIVYVIRLMPKSKPHHVTC